MLYRLQRFQHKSLDLYCFLIIMLILLFQPHLWIISLSMRFDNCSLVFFSASDIINHRRVAEVK